MGQRAALALALYDAGMFLDKLHSPEGKGFRLKLHDKQPEAPLSPYYIDLRRLRGFPTVMAQVAETLLGLPGELHFDLLADIPISISPVVGVMAVKSNIRMVTPRPPKERGTKSSVEGVFSPGERVLLVDDLITGADSKLEAIETLTEAGLIVQDVAVVIDREQGGGQELARRGVFLHVAFTVTEMLLCYELDGKINRVLFDEILDYIEAN